MDGRKEREYCGYIQEGVHNIEVVLTNDIGYYKKRKVRVLNGSHTNLVPTALMLGAVTVYDCMVDEKLSAFVERSLKDEIIPYVSSDIAATTVFANSVKDRFMNPFLNHQLVSISLNSISKWRARVLPSFKDYYADHGEIAPNLLFVGLGCENNGMDGIKQTLAPYERSNIEYFNCKDVEDEHAYGMEILKSFIEKAKGLQREEIDFSQLCIGLKCGGSDGYSGLTANPLVGKITDRVVPLNGSAILTEVPEMFGAEQLLMNKCKNQEVFEKYKKMIEDFKAYYTKQGFPVYENPSPGNKKGGITTLEEKSLGCVEKAGTTEIVDVLSYGELVKETGGSALNAPGNDLIAATALAASGCQIVLFTTGRGTPFSTFVPTMKIGTNNTISAHKSNWIDFNAYSIDEDALFDLLQKTINGEYECKSEDIREIAFYKTGVTL